MRFGYAAISEIIKAIEYTSDLFFVLYYQLVLSHLRGCKASTA